MEKKVDVVVVGGGLAGSLAALRIKKAKPELKVLLLEKTDVLGGHQTWNFYESDLSEDALEWVKELGPKSWDRTTVQFPRIEKTTEGRFYALRSKDLQKHVIDTLGADCVIFNAEADRLTENQVVVIAKPNAGTYDAELVLDARGFAGPAAPRVNGYHKFVAYDLTTTEPHGLQTPIIMDATCPQLDGFRFYTLLPWDEKKLLVQETFYSDTPDLNIERISRSIESFAERRGWKIASRDREEKNSLPMPMTAEYLTPSLAGEALPIGARGGYFHATTSNALPDAVRVADFLAALADLSTPKARESLFKWRRPWLSRQRFFRLVNRFLFFASEPSLRYLVLQGLYEQPSDVVSRYTGGRTSWGDRLRILSGRPPLPFDRALKSFSERSVQARPEE